MKNEKPNFPGMTQKDRKLLAMGLYGGLIGNFFVGALLGIALILQQNIFLLITFSIIVVGGVIFIIQTGSVLSEKTEEPPPPASKEDIDILTKKIDTLTEMVGGLSSTGMVPKDISLIHSSELRSPDSRPQGAKHRQPEQREHQGE